MAAARINSSSSFFISSIRFSRSLRSSFKFPVSAAGGFANATNFSESLRLILLLETIQNRSEVTPAIPPTDAKIIQIIWSLALIFSRKAAFSGILLSSGTCAAFFAGLLDALASPFVSFWFVSRGEAPFAGAVAFGPVSEGPASVPELLFAPHALIMDDINKRRIVRKSAGQKGASLRR
ncbi:MAG TPA: hypothetical protein VJW20_01940 [Candidatus Angelobacter sp.]|nr:hypothetical protein [Candidatus Angelobacter sp.]